MTMAYLESKLNFADDAIGQVGILWPKMFSS